MYERPILPDWNRAWLLAPASIWAILISLALSIGTDYHRPGVRHALPDPYVPQCYSIEWRAPGYCEFRGGNIDRNKKQG